MVNRIGGLAADAEPDWLRAETRLMSDAETAAGGRAGLVDAEPVAGLTRGVAVLDPETIAAYGVSGPAARASGVDLDLRTPAALPGVRGPRRPDRTAGHDVRRCLVPAAHAGRGDDHQRPAGPGLRRPAGHHRRTGRGPARQDHPGARGPGVRGGRGAARHRRGLPELARGEDALAAPAADAVVQQRRQPGADTGRGRPQRAGGDPGVDRLRGRRHRQVRAAGQETWRSTS